MLLQSSNCVNYCFASFASASFGKDADAGCLGLQEEREREKASKQADESPEAELNLISDDEIEAMRREAEEEERNERKAEVSLSALINLIKVLFTLECMESALCCFLASLSSGAEFKVSFAYTRCIWTSVV